MGVVTARKRSKRKQPVTGTTLVYWEGCWGAGHGRMGGGKWYIIAKAMVETAQEGILHTS